MPPKKLLIFARSRAALLGLILPLVFGVVWMVAAERNLYHLGGVNLRLNLLEDCRTSHTSLYRHIVEKAPAKSQADALGSLKTCKAGLLRRLAPGGLEDKKLDPQVGEPLRIFLQSVDNLSYLTEPGKKTLSNIQGQTAPEEGDALGYYLNGQNSLGELSSVFRQFIPKSVWAPFQFGVGALLVIFSVLLALYHGLHNKLPKQGHLSRLMSIMAGTILIVLGLLTLNSVLQGGLMQRPTVAINGGDWHLARMLDNIKTATLDLESATEESLGAPPGSTKEKRYNLTLQRFLRVVTEFRNQFVKDPAEQAKHEEVLKNLQESSNKYAAILIQAKQFASTTPPRLRESQNKLTEAVESPWRADLISQIPSRFYEIRMKDYEDQRGQVTRSGILRSTIAIFLMVVGVLAVLLGRFMAMSRIIHPLKIMEGATAELRLGHYDHPVSHPEDDEMGQLARAIDALRLELGQKFQHKGDPIVESLSFVLGEEGPRTDSGPAIETQVLEQVQEGVLLFSSDGHCIFANQTAFRLLSFDRIEEVSRLGEGLFDEATGKLLHNHVAALGSVGPLELTGVHFGQDRLYDLCLSRVSGQGSSAWLLRVTDATETRRLAKDLQSLTETFGDIRGQWETLVSYLSGLPIQGGLKDRWRAAPAAAKAEWAALYLSSPGEGRLLLHGRSAHCPTLPEQWEENTSGPFGLAGKLGASPSLVDLEGNLILAAIPFGDRKQAAGILLVCAPKESPLFTQALMAVLAEEAAISSLASLLEKLGQQMEAQTAIWQTQLGASPLAILDIDPGDGSVIAVNTKLAELLGLGTVPSDTQELIARLNWPTRTEQALRQSSRLGVLPVGGEKQVNGFLLFESQHSPKDSRQIRRWIFMEAEEAQSIQVSVDFAESQLNGILETMPLPLWLIDQDDRILKTSTEVKKMGGLEQLSEPDTLLVDAFPDSSKESLKQALAQARSFGKSQQLTLTIGGVQGELMVLTEDRGLALVCFIPKTQGDLRREKFLKEAFGLLKDGVRPILEQSGLTLQEASKHIPPSKQGEIPVLLATLSNQERALRLWMAGVLQDVEPEDGSKEVPVEKKPAAAPKPSAEPPAPVEVKPPPEKEPPPPPIVEEMPVQEEPLAPEPEPEPEPVAIIEVPPEKEISLDTSTREVLSQVVDTVSQNANQFGIMLLPQSGELYTATPAPPLVDTLVQVITFVLAHTPRGGMVRLEALPLQGWIDFTITGDNKLLAPSSITALEKEDGPPAGSESGLNNLFMARNSAAGLGGIIFAEITARNETVIHLVSPGPGERQAPLSLDSFRVLLGGESLPDQKDEVPTEEEVSQNTPEEAPEVSNEPEPDVVIPRITRPKRNMVQMELTGTTSQRLERFLQDKNYQIFPSDISIDAKELVITLRHLDPEQLFGRPADPATENVFSPSPKLLVPGLKNAQTAGIPFGPYWVAGQEAAWHTNLAIILDRLEMGPDPLKVLLLVPNKKEREATAEFIREKGAQVMEADNPRKAQLLADAAPPSLLVAKSNLGSAESLLLLEIMKFHGSLGGLPMVVDQLVPLEFSSRERVRIGLIRFLERHPLAFKEMAQVIQQTLQHLT